jgi:Zn ribbon nucleic-acid-binding protein
MAAGSEQISKKWIEGAKRECAKCGVKITNLAKQVGEVRTRYGPKKHGSREIICVDCKHKQRELLIEKTRKELGLGEKKPDREMDNAQ